MATAMTRELEDRTCGISAALDIVGDRWSLLIVREIMFGNRRFQGMADTLGIPRDRLAARLKFLVETEVLEQRAYQAAPPRAEYYLTASGLELASVLVTLFDWGRRRGHVADDGVVLHHHDHTLRPQLVCAECGEAVEPDSLTRTGMKSGSGT